MQEIPCFQGIKAIGILFFPFSSPQPFQKKKRKNTGLWEWIIMGVSMDEVPLEEWKQNEKKRKRKRFWCWEPSVKVWWQQDSHFFGYVGNIRVFATFGDWRDGEKRRKGRGSAAGFACFNHRKYQGFCLFSEGWLREREGKEEGCEGEKKGKKRTL